MPSQRYTIGTSMAPVELKLPSHVDPKDAQSPHNVVLVRKLDPQALISAGFIDQLDVLTGLVDQVHIAPKQGRGAKASKKNVDEANAVEMLKSFGKNRTSIADAIKVIDWIVEYCVVEPSVRRPVTTDQSGAERFLTSAERDSGTIYTDMVDLDDKNAILEFVMGGVNDLKPFREERKRAVVNLEGV